MAKKISANVFVPVEAEELEELKGLLDIRPNKAIFLEHLPTDRKTGKPIYSRRQLDYGLERGEIQKGLLEHLRKFRDLIREAQAARDTEPAQM